MQGQLYTINHSFLLWSVIGILCQMTIETQQRLTHCHLNHNKKVVPRHFYIGHRKLQVLHTRLRTKCSALNYDLFIKDIVASPLCRCGEVENAEHYFLKCSFYRNQRAELIRTVSQFCRATIGCLLRGNNDLPYQRMFVYSRLCKHTSKTVKDFKTCLLAL